MNNLAGIKFYIVTFILTISFAVLLSINQPGGTASSLHTDTFDAEKIALLDKKFEEAQRQKELQKEKFEFLLQEIQKVGTVNSIVIQKNGFKIAEHYFEWMSEDKATNIKSASKSILSLLVGIAIQKGYLEGVHQTLDSFFPNYFQKNPDSIKAAITIADLLTMRSGLRTTSFSHYDDWVSSNNWVWYTLNRPIVDRSQKRMLYSTGTSHLLSVILTKATGMSTKEFVNQYLFEPMEIEFHDWMKDPQGYYLGGNDMALRPTDMLKIGEMVMNHGNFRGKQLVPIEWITESLKTYTYSTASDYNYGYMWWNTIAGGYKVNFAWGYAGQYILMFPELNSVVVMTSDIEKNKGDRSYQKEVFDFISNHLVPFLENKPLLLVSNQM